MRKNDWMGLGTSVAVHGLLLALFALLAAGQPPVQPLGFIEVELGPFAEGRPVQRAETNRPDDEPAEEPAPEPETPAPEPQQEEQPAPQTTPPEESRPVDLPDQEEEVQDEEEVETSEAETIAPQAQNEAEQESTEVQPEPQQEEQEAAAGEGGAAEGDAGAAEGDEGEGEDQEESAPYNIEGLNREALNDPLPEYVKKENAVLQFRIVVSPSGEVTSVIPLRKGVPELERAVQAALQRWRFNPLPRNAPQVNQPGTITFRFRLE